jgi:acetyltransferase
MGSIHREENTRGVASHALMATEWPRCFHTRNGVEYRVRPIRADDVERDRHFIEGLSPHSRYDRMMGLLRKPSTELLDRLVRVDYRRSMALVAVIDEGSDESIIGVARYGGDSACCELAIAVADEWQSQGVGTTLSELLLAYAKAHGVRRIYAVVFAGNTRMLKLANKLHMTIRRSTNDKTIVEAWRTL